MSRQVQAYVHISVCNIAQACQECFNPQSLLITYKHASNRVREQPANTAGNSAFNYCNSVDYTGK